LTTIVVISRAPSKPVAVAAHGIKRLLTSLDVLEEAFGAALEAESHDIAANVRAHRRVFERLGFFAEGEDGALWAFEGVTRKVASPSFRGPATGFRCVR